MLLASGAKAQVGIGTNMPDNSAALEVKATDKGLLVPRMSATQRGLIGLPAKGLLVYQSESSASGGVQSGFWFNAGTPVAPSWTYLTASGAVDNLGNHTATQVLNLQGNVLTGTGEDIGSAKGIGVRVLETNGSQADARP